MLVLTLMELTTQGHQKAIVSMTYASNSLYTGSFDGVMCRWDLNSGACKFVDHDNRHSNSVVSLSSYQDSVYSVGLDKLLRSLHISEDKFK